MRMRVKNKARCAPVAPSLWNWCFLALSGQLPFLRNGLRVFRMISRWVGLAGIRCGVCILGALRAGADEVGVSAGLALLRAGDAVRAEAELRGALPKLTSADARAHAYFLLGVARLRAKRVEDANYAFARCLLQSPSYAPPSGANTFDDGSQALEKVRQTLLSEIRAEGGESGTRVLVDGVDRGRTPLTVRVPIGAHTVRFLRPGGVSTADEHSVVANPRRVARVLAGRGDPNVQASVPWHRKRRTWGLITLGLGAALLAPAVILGRSASSSADELQAGARAGTLDFTRFQSLASSADSSARLANVLFGVAGAAAITGLVLTLLGDPPQDVLARGWRVEPTLLGAALVVRY